MGHQLRIIGIAQLASHEQYSPYRERVTWNVSERSHGKGAPDGVWGVLKHKADVHVLTGGDLYTPRDPYEYLKKNSEDAIVQWINEEEIPAIDEILPPFSG